MGSRMGEAHRVLPPGFGRSGTVPAGAADRCGTPCPAGRVPVEQPPGPRPLVLVVLAEELD
ncbi:hypothetical protein, partial [Streptomyces sp. NPDC005093]